MSDTVYVVEFAPVASPSDAEFPACVYVRAANVASAREWVASQPGCRRVGAAVKLSPEQVEARPAGVSIATAETATEEADDPVGVAAEECGKFVVEIEPGNAAMQTGNDVADMLADLSESLRTGEPTAWNGEGSLLDRNGNVVGRYSFHDFN